jgi:hypothetical protein
VATKTFCDICGEETKNTIRVGWKNEYCIKCWKNRKNWSKIHKNALEKD